MLKNLKTKYDKMANAFYDSGEDTIKITERELEQQPILNILNQKSNKNSWFKI